jgi:hypothetical protein
MQGYSPDRFRKRRWSLHIRALVDDQSSVIFAAALQQSMVF